MQSKSSRRDESIIVQLWYKFFPYWPLFFVLIAIAITGAWFYLRYQVPYYQASSSVLIKDESKGTDDSKITESFNYLSSKKIMENEIEIFKSKKLMKEVVKRLNLYAPVYEEGKMKPQLAYSTSPIKVEAKDMDLIEGMKKIYFKFDESKKEVIIDGKSYPTNTWVTTNNGVLRFLLNSNYTISKNPLFFYLINPKTATQNTLARLNITPQGKLSSIVSLKLVDESPKRAEDILNKLIESYNDLSIREKNSLATNTLAFVEDRLKSVQNDLAKIENKIQNYKSSSDAIDISTQGRLFLQNVSTNDQKLSDINMQMAVLSQVENYVQSKDKDGGIVPSTLGVNDPTLSSLVDKLYAAELEYESLKKTTADNNPVLVSVADRIEKIKPSILENIRSQRRSLQASGNNLSGTNGQYSRMIQKIPEKERELLEISREQAIKTNIYNFLLQKREETAFSNSKTTTDIRVVDAADASLAPVSPKKTIIYFSFILIALVICIAFIYAKETFNRTILFRDEIENFTSFPIIGEIAYEKSNNPVVIEDGKPGIIVEQFRKLRTSFHYLGINATTRKKILITSTISGEGKSFTALNLSLTLAAEGKKVVIIEADLRKPTLYKKLGLAEKDGLANFLHGELDLDKVLKPTEYPNLSIIPAGPFQDNSSALFLNNRIEVLLNSLESLFDYIIIDSAPAGLLSDAYILSPLCDATLYVVRHKYTPKLYLKTLEQNNRIHELKNLAIVFNGVHSRGFTKNDYGYGYSNGYVYGYMPEDKPGKKKSNGIMQHYDETFYNTYAAYSSGSASKVVPHIIELFSPKSVVDVGCGIGTWLSVFEKQGVKDILGIDGSYVNRSQLLFDQKNFFAHDLTQPLPKEKIRRFDLAISLEVGEHLPEAKADQLVTTLVSLAQVVLFSAAIPHQGGTNHVNEQWQNYWAKLFRQKGYATIDFLKSRTWGDPQVEYYYSQNSLLYIETTYLEKFQNLKEYVVSADNAMLSRVHPIKWLQANNRPPPPLRNLIKAIPVSLMHTLRYHIKRYKKKT